MGPDGRPIFARSVSRRRWLAALSEVEITSVDPVEAQAERIRSGPASGGGTRGAVTALTHAAARRGQEALVVILPALCALGAVFGALTYGLLHPDAATAKRHFGVLRQRWIDCASCDPVGWWRFEYQRRQAPHFHPVVAGLCEKHRSLEDWLDITGDSGSRHSDRLRYGVHTQQLRADVQALVTYLSGVVMDMAKQAQSIPPAGEFPGRWWGRIGAERCRELAQPFTIRWHSPADVEQRIVDLDEQLHPQRRPDGDGLIWCRTSWVGAAASYLALDDPEPLSKELQQ